MKTKLASFQHLLVALILISKGIDKIQHHHSNIGGIILVMGIVILIYFIIIKILKRSRALFETIVHFFESIALFLTSYIYFQEDKVLLLYVTLLAACGFFIAALLHLRKHRSV